MEQKQGDRSIPYATPMTPLPELIPPTSVETFVRLDVMMFLQYAVWGMWLLLLPTYLSKSTAEGGLGFAEWQKGAILALGAGVGSALAPFIAGQLADRLMNAEKALALLLILGGVVNAAMGYATEFNAFLALTVCYSVLYMPTLSLTNSISFQHLQKPTTQFTFVRVWGTLGWVAASSLFPAIWQTSAIDSVNVARIADSLKVSGALSVAYGIYSWFGLPECPPKKEGNPFAFLQAFALLKNPIFLVLVLVTLPISMIHTAFFFQFNPFLVDGLHIPAKYFGWISSIGQVSEVFFLALLGLGLKRLGFKIILLIGILGYVARYGIFSLGEPTWLIISAQAFHGMCYACYFACAFILVEKIAPPSIRHSAQTVFGIIILGAGPLLTGVYNTYLVRGITGKAGAPLKELAEFESFWSVQSLVALGAGVVMAVVFVAMKDKFVVPEDRPAPAQEGFPVELNQPNS